MNKYIDTKLNYDSYGYKENVEQLDLSISIRISI